MPRGHRCNLSGVRREASIAGRKRAIEERNGLADVRKIFQELLASKAIVLVDSVMVRGNSVGYKSSVGVEEGESAIGECIVGEPDLVGLEEGMLDWCRERRLVPTWSMNNMLLDRSQLKSLGTVMIDSRLPSTASQGPVSENMPIIEELPIKHRTDQITKLNYP